MKGWMCTAITATVVLLGGCGREPEPQVEFLPPPMPVVENEAPRTPGTNRFYRVQKGDDLYTVAMMWAVPLEVLKATNNLTGTELKPGQTLLIPDVEEPLPTWSTNAEENPILRRDEDGAEPANAGYGFAAPDLRR
jgi:LysM repeat protein